jgi:hypothetical protein
MEQLQSSSLQLIESFIKQHDHPVDKMVRDSQMVYSTNSAFDERGTRFESPRMDTGHLG